MPARTLDEFSPELMQLLQQGAHQAVSVTLPNRGLAVSLRYRLYHLRSEVRKTAQLHMLHLTRVTITIEPNPRERHEGPHVVTVLPVDNDIAPYIKSALKDMPTIPSSLDSGDPSKAPSLPFELLDQLPVVPNSADLGKVPGEPDPEVED